MKRTTTNTLSRCDPDKLNPASTVPCPDVVTFEASPTPTTFQVGGVDYTLSMSFVDGQGTPVSKFITEENQTNVANLVGQFTVVPPLLNSLTPNTTSAGSPAFTMLANGAGFVNGSVVTWNGVNRPTTFVNINRLSVAIPAADVTLAGTANVRVVNPNGLQSGTLPFTITPVVANPPPILNSLTPNTTMAGSPAFNTDGQWLTICEWHHGHLE